MKTPVDPMYFVAAHEAGHAVAYILAHRALGRNYPSFKRIFIRRDFQLPYFDHKNREINCSGLCEGVSEIYTPAEGLALFNAETQPGWKSEILTKMEWAIFVSLAGPFR
jgi:hypothetical protein